MPRNALCITLLLASWLALVPLPAGASLTCEIVPRFMGAYLQNHIRQQRLGEELELRTIDTYLRRIDPSQTVLLESEVEQIKQDFRGSFGKLKDGNCDFLTELHTRILERQKYIEEYVASVVQAEDYEIDTSVELLLDPDKRGRPTTREQQHDLLDRLVHFQMSNYVSAGETLDEAKRLLLHRYELRTKRFAELDHSDLYASFLDGFASSLDPHSNYLSAEVLEDFRISMTLSLEGIGVALSERDGYAVVERIIPGGAAARQHVLQPKDKLITVAQEDGEAVNIIDMPLREAVSLIRGKKGSRVRLTVLRQGERTERFPVTITRDKVDLEEQAAKLSFEEREVDGRKFKLAILELPSFYGGASPNERQSTEDVARLLQQVNQEKADGLVLDLSRNGGGLLDHAVTISGFFVRKGEIVGVEDARGRRQILADDDESILYSGPMVVHTSRVSASAAEILAGALKDYKRAVITGDDHTFGKGTVQTVSSLPPGQGALKITTAMFFRPGGKSTQNDGVRADVMIPSMLAGEDFGEKTQPYALENQATTPFLSSYANAIPPSGRWRPVSTDLVSKLASRSAERVETSERFDELREKLEEAQESGGRIRLSEMLKEKESEQAQADASNGGSAPDDDATIADASDDAEAPQEISPQLEEAMNILLDLIVLQS